MVTQRAYTSRPYIIGWLVNSFVQTYDARSFPKFPKKHFTSIGIYAKMRFNLAKNIIERTRDMFFPRGKQRGNTGG